jgi:tetratricopeptide (TPR) repeat protein
MRQHEKAIAVREKSVELNPNGALVCGILGSTLSSAGRPYEAIDHLKQAIRLNLFPASWYFNALGVCYRQKGQYEEARIPFKSEVFYRIKTKERRPLK